MPCIRRRYHYGNVWLAPHLIEATTALCGQTVDVALPDDQFKRVLFGGFIELGQIAPDMHKVKLLRIEAFNPIASLVGEWLEYGPNCIMLGAYRAHTAYLVLDGCRPIAWCAMPKKVKERPHNIHSIKPKG